MLVRICVACELEYETKSPVQRYCSYACREKGSAGSKKRLRFIVLHRDNFACVYCGRSVKEHKVTLQIDHIVPQSKGGKDEESNLVSACYDCNNGKGDCLLNNYKI